MRQVINLAKELQVNPGENYCLPGAPGWEYRVTLVDSIQFLRNSVCLLWPYIYVADNRRKVLANLSGETNHAGFPDMNFEGPDAGKRALEYVTLAIQTGIETGAQSNG